MLETIEQTTIKTKHQQLKIELEELKKQRANKSLPVPVQRLIDGEISKQEDRLTRWGDYSTRFIKTHSRIERMSRKLADLRQDQRKFGIALGICVDEQNEIRPKFIVEDVVAFIKKSGGAVTYAQLAAHIGMGRIKIKKHIEKNAACFKVDAAVIPHKVTLK